MFGVGAPELIIIAVIALLVFGPSKLPEIGKTIGKGLREFKKASSDLKDQVNPLSDIEEPAPKPEPEPKPKSITKGKSASVKKPVRRKPAEKLNVSAKKPVKTTKSKTPKKPTSHRTSPKSDEAVK